MAIKLIALDIDGTLTSKPREISQRNRMRSPPPSTRASRLFVSTGRGCFATSPWKLIDVHGLDPVRRRDDNDIDTESVISMHALDRTDSGVLAYSAEVGIHAQIYVNDVVIFEKPSRLPRSISSAIRCRTKSIGHPKKSYSNVPKILAFSEGNGRTKCCRRIATGFTKAQVSRSMPGYIEIICRIRRRDRACGARKSAPHRPGGVAAVGDNYLDQNDRMGGTGVCVEDGAETVKAVADLIVPRATTTALRILLKLCAESNGAITAFADRERRRTEDVFQLCVDIGGTDRGRNRGPGYEAGCKACASFRIRKIRSIPST
jgi:hypothetical protein